MTKKVALITFHTGFNYGTSLQAFAMNELIKESGYVPVMLWHNDGFIKGRDVTLSKIFIIFIRFLLHPFASKKVIGAYKDNYSYKLMDETKKKFQLFEKDFMDVKKMSFRNMKKLCASDEIKSVCCGSDQIWKSNLLYVSPYYYLRFAPKYKRIAYAPSFGNTEVPYYNKRILIKYLNDFNTLSVREESGANIIQQLTGKKCFVALDPTLAINPNCWKKFVKEDNSKEYVLCYFLDEPTENVLNIIKSVQKQYNLSVIVIPYIYDSFLQFENCIFENAGPIEFLNLVFNAKIILTDSYHCSIFSVIFQKIFFIFERNHKNAISGNTRIENFMKLIGLQERYIKNDYAETFNIYFQYDYSIANARIEKERARSLQFLRDAIKGVNVEKK